MRSSLFSALVKVADLPLGYETEWTPQMIRKAQNETLKNVNAVSSRNGKAPILGFDIHGMATSDPSEVSGNYGYEKYHQREVAPYQRKALDSTKELSGKVREHWTPAEMASFKAQGIAPNFNPEIIASHGVPAAGFLTPNGKGTPEQINAEAGRFLRSWSDSGQKINPDMAAMYGITPGGGGSSNQTPTMSPSQLARQSPGQALTAAGPGLPPPTMQVNSGELIPASAPKSVEIPASELAPSVQSASPAGGRGAIPATQAQNTMVAAQGPAPRPEIKPSVEMGTTGTGKYTMMPAPQGRTGQGTMISTGQDAIPASAPLTQSMGPAPKPQANTIGAAPSPMDRMTPSEQASHQQWRDELRRSHGMSASGGDAIPATQRDPQLLQNPSRQTMAPITEKPNTIQAAPATQRDPSLGRRTTQIPQSAGPSSVDRGWDAIHAQEMAPKSIPAGRGPASAPAANSNHAIPDLHAPAPKSIPAAAPAAAASHHIPDLIPASGVQRVEQAAAHAAPGAGKGLQRVAGALKGKGALAAGAGLLAAGGLGAGFMAKRRAQMQQAAQDPNMAKAASELAFFDELVKVGAISEEQAGASLDRIERLQQQKPTGGQVARYATIGAVASPAISAMSNAIKGKALFDGKGGGVKGIVRGIAGEAAKGAVATSMIPALRHEGDRRAEISTLKHFVEEQSKESFQTSQYSGPLSYGGFKQTSAQAPAANPDLTTVIQQKTAGIPTTPAGVLARASAVAKTPGVAKGPSISSIAKPPGFGKPIAAAIHPSRGV